MKKNTYGYINYKDQSIISFTDSVLNFNKAVYMQGTTAGNGGVILPDLHYGRDALVGIALFLTLLTERDISIPKGMFVANSNLDSKVCPPINFAF